MWAACAASARPPSTSPMWPAGAFDAYWERGLNSWDMAAGILLVREAGGFVSDADGGADPLAAALASPAATRPCTASCSSC